MLLLLRSCSSLAYYVLHQDNYQNTRDTRFWLFKPGPKPLPLGEVNPKVILLLDLQLKSIMNLTPICLQDLVSTLS